MQQPTVNPGKDEAYEQLRAWYLASLRQTAVSTALGLDGSTLSPATLINADSQLMQMLASSIPIASEKGTSTSGTNRLPLFIVAALLVILIIVCLMTGISATHGVAATAAGAIAFAALGAIAAFIWKDRQSAQAIALAKKKEDAIVDYALDVICSLDATGRFIAVSPASLRCWGRVPEQLVKKDLSALLHDDDRDRVLSLIGAKAGDLKFETRLTRPDTTIAYTRWTASWSASQQVYFCTVTDITAAKELELMKQQYIAFITHELRSPLTAFGFLLQMLGEERYGKLPPPALEVILGAQGDLDRLVRLISVLLDLDKIEAHEFTVELKPMLLDSTIEKSVQTLKGLIEEKRIDVKLPSQRDVKVLGDEERLIQVFVNLLSNAIKFSQPESAVEIELKPLHNWVDVHIRDHGPGIPPHEQRLIFQRFKQAKQSKGGTGLGLAICKGIMESHGGTIGVESEPGKGSTFWIRLRNASRD